MMKIIFVVLAVITCPFVWITIAVPLLARSSGLRFKVGSLPIDRRDDRLSKRQSFWFAGVLGWGVGISLLGVMTALLIDRTKPTFELLFGVVCCCIVTAFWTDGDWTYPLDSELPATRNSTTT
jgi:hypothetical protein